MRLTEKELAALDLVRGDTPRSTWVKSLVRVACQRRSEHGRPCNLDVVARPALAADAVAIERETISGTRPLPGQAVREVVLAPDVRRGRAA